MRLAVDTWAYVEVFFNGPRKKEVEDLLKEADSLMTTRDILAETFGFIVGRTRRTSTALEWLAALRAGRTQVVSPSMDDIEDLLFQLKQDAGLSYADASLGAAALERDIGHVVSEDGGFRGLRLVPVFAY